MGAFMNQAATLKEWGPEGQERRKAHADPIARLRGKAPLCPRVVSFSSGKGGVGKTNMVTNIALAIARLGKRVLILDADLGLANVDIMLGLVPKYTIRHVFSGEKRLEEILMQGPGGMLILPAGSGIPELVHLDESEKLFLLNEMEGLGDSIDLMLIDNAAGISENVLYFNLAAQQRVIVVTPEPTSPLWLTAFSVFFQWTTWVSYPGIVLYRRRYATRRRYWRCFRIPKQARASWIWPVPF
jgi:flagellar biosynthesis protein FlhG